MLNIYLCDDNPNFLKQYRLTLEGLAKKHDVSIKITAFTNGEQLLFHMSESPDIVDIVYLDVIMEGLNGIETAKKLREYGCHAELIFLSASEEFVFDSFDVLPLHYILKETATLEKIETIFLKAVDICEKKEQEFFVCEANSITKKIPIDTISFFEVQNRIITVHYGAEAFSFYSRLDKVEEELRPKHFLRVHRSFLIQLRYIDSIKKDSIALITGDVVPMGSTYARTVKTAFSNYLLFN